MDFIQLYTDFFQPLTRYALKFAGDQTAAEDLAQEAFCRAYQRLKGIQQSLHSPAAGLAFPHHPQLLF